MSSGGSGRRPDRVRIACKAARRSRQCGHSGRPARRSRPRPDRLCAAHVQRHPADEIGEQVGLEKRQTLEHLGAILEDVLKSPKVTFSEEGWSPTVYNVRAATRPRVLVGGMEKPQIEVLEGVWGARKNRRFPQIPSTGSLLFCLLRQAMWRFVRHSSNPATDPTPVAALPPSPSVRRRLTFYASCVNTTRAANSRWKSLLGPREHRVGG